MKKENKFFKYWLNIKKKISKISVFFSDKNKKKPLLFDIICFLVFILITAVLASNTVIREHPTPLSYTQKGEVLYKVYLRENEFYNEEYLQMGKSYVASLIKSINIDFNYLFNVDNKTNANFNYRVLADLIIENNSGTSQFFEKQYVLLDSKEKKLVDDKELFIKERVEIDYGYYNQLANSFKATYGVDTYSYLNVYLDVQSKSTDDPLYKIDDDDKVLIKIPLSEKAIEINLSANNQSVTKKIVPSEVVIFNIIFLLLEIIFFVPAIIFFVRIFKIIFAKMPVMTDYDVFVKKVLKNYDRLIVETNTKLDTNNYNIINVKKFDELLDAHDNLRLPILYNNTSPHRSGMFYIINNNDVYLLKVSNMTLKK